MTGAEFVKKIRPLGCALFLIMFIVLLVYLFTAGREPVKGYVPPHDSEYYAQSADTLSELGHELETNVFPALDGVKSCAVEGDRLVVTVDAQEYIVVRAAVLRYYDESLFEFVKDE